MNMTTEPFEMDNPFTKEQVEDFNRYTHFPSDINREFNEQTNAHEEKVRAELARHGVTEFSPRLKTALWYYRKAVYEYYLDRAHSRNIAPPWSVVGSSNYPTHRLPRARKIDEKASERLDTAKQYVDRAVGEAISGKLETKIIEKWGEVAKKTTKIQFGKLYAEDMHKQHDGEDTRFAQEVRGGFWDHAYRSQGRALWAKLKELE